MGNLNQKYLDNGLEDAEFEDFLAEMENDNAERRHQTNTSKRRLLNMALSIMIMAQPFPTNPKAPDKSTTAPSITVDLLPNLIKSIQNSDLFTPQPAESESPINYQNGTNEIQTAE